MISKFFTIQHTADTQKALELRSSQLVTSFLNDSTDEELKSRIYERYLGRIDDSLSLTTDKATLDQIFEYLRSNQLISKAPLETFLCFSSDQNLLKRLQALILIVSLEHRRLFNLGNERLISVGRTKSALDAFRRFLQDKDKNKNSQEINIIERELPNPLQDLKQVAQQLDSFLARLPKSKKIYIQRRLQPIHRVLDDVADGKLKNVREREKQGDVATENHEQETEQNPEEAAAHGIPVKKGSYNAVTRAGKVDDEEAAHAVIREYPDTTHNTFNETEFLSDNSPDRSYVTLAPDSSTPASLCRSYMLSAVHAKTVAGHIERNEKRLVTSMSQLTRHDIHCLKEALQQKAETQPTVVFLVHLMLTTGRRLDQILRSSKIDHASDLKQPGDAIILQKNGKMYWVYRADLPLHPLEGDLEIFIDRQTSPIILPLPPPPQNSYMLALPPLTADIQQDVIGFIDEVNRVNKTRLTSNRIAAYLSDFLHQRGVDDVVNALVTGNPSIQEAGTYYYQYEHKSLLEAYELFLTEFFALEIEDFKKEALIKHKGGSQLIVKPIAVSALFEHLASKMRTSSRDIADFHNSYTYYILHLLNFATGHRPVRDPFDDLDHIDLLNKKIFISDKESRQTASSARVLRLSETAIKQIQLYIEHLKELQLQLFVINPDAANAVAQTLSGKNRLLFLLEENEMGSYQIQPLSPKYVQEYLGALFDIPTNWHRHYLRTFLSISSVPAELIDAWMGHAKPGQEGFNLFSGLSMKYMWLISTKIELEMDKLGIRPIGLPTVL